MDKYETLSSSSFQHICRTCLIHNELFLIDEVIWEGIELRIIIKDWTSLQVVSDMELPQNMCESCIKHMYDTYHFLYKCKKSERVLNNILNRETVKDKIDNSKVESLSNEENIENNLFDNDDQFVKEECNLDNFANISDQGFDIEDPDEVKSEKFSNKEQAENKIVNSNIINKIQSPPYICITCNASYQTHEELKKHKNETKHRSRIYKCQYCPKMYDAYRYEGHVRTHTGEKPNKCVTCGKCFNFKTDLKRHMTMHTEVKPYNCRFCSKGFAQKEYLRNHERKHTGEQLLCPFCGKRFYSSSTLSHHEKTHIDSKKTRKHSKKTHIHSKGPLGCCEICGKTYISKTGVEYHIKLTHQETKYECHLCGKKFKHKSGLEVHIKSHSGQNSNYPCGTCGKQFAWKSSLYQHKRVHTGDTKYQCKECLHICTNKRHLANHIRVHTGDKPFACVYCGKLFALKNNMQAHSKIHTGEKNHVCKLCNKAFYDTRGLKRHMAIHEKNGDDGSTAVA